ncbi:MAG: hypothetical protein Q9186_000179 [Xanthomendoza sp. 1 TL-2023]
MLDFIKGVNASSGEFTCIRDPRSAEEVGSLLERHQVERVVLNACRSTHQSGPGETIPRVLRRHGVREIVAMSYQVYSRCVQYFTSWFYAIVFTTRNIPFAVSCGRKSLEKSAERLSRFGTKLPIMDHVMPVCYDSQDWSQRSEIADIASMMLEIPIDNDGPEDEPALVFGREHDLLKLECMLLEGGRPVLLVGEPGIGKSVLLAVLAQWWSTTGYVVATHTYQLSQDRAFTVDKMCRDLHENFHCPGPYNGQQSLVSFLRATRYLVIIDSLESMTVEESTSLGKQRVAMKNLIKALRGGKTVVLLSSRREEDILSPYTSTFPLFGLMTIPAIHLMRAVLSSSRKNITNLRSMDSMSLLTHLSSTTGIDWANEDSGEWLKEIEALKQRTDSSLESLYATWSTDEDGVYLEGIHKLVNGHPLALGLLAFNMTILGPDVSPKRFMLALLEGAPMVTNLKALSHGNDEQIEGLRSLGDLDRMIFDLQTEMPVAFKGVVGLLATFWKVIPTRGLHPFQKFQIKEHAISSDRNMEIIAMFDSLESAGLCKSIPASLKESLAQLRTGTLDALKEKHIQLEFYEFLEAEGLLEKVPQMKRFLKVMRESLSQIPTTDAGANEICEALSSHEGTFLFNSMREILLEKSDGLDDEARRTIRSWDSWEEVLAELAGDGPATELFHILTSTRSSLIRPALKALTDSHLIEVPLSDIPPEAEGMEYIKTSPLLTIMLRGHAIWCDERPFVASHKVALALLYAQRCHSWPTPVPATCTTAWNSAKSEADIEFYNLVSAAAISKDQLRDTKRGFIVEEALMNAVVRLEWSLMTDKTRAPVVQMLWELCLDEAQQTVKTLESSSTRPQKKKWRGSFLPQPSENDIPLEQRQTELRLFSRRSASIVLALGLLRFYNHFDDNRTRRCSDIIKATTRDIRKDSYPLKLIQEGISSHGWILDLSTKVAESSVSKWNFRRKKTAQDITRIVEKQYPSTLRTDAGKNNAVSSFDLDACPLDPQTYSAVATQFPENIQEIHRYIKSGNYDAARELLNAAFEEELEYGQKDQGRRSALLFFSSIVSAKQGRLSDAVRDLEEYRRLSKIPGEHSDFISMGTMTSFMRRSLTWILKMESKLDQNPRLEPCSCCYKRRGKRRCLGCGYTLYCSTECHKQHWSTHKKVCKSIGSGYSM